MPNQRAANKKQFGITLTKEEIDRIDAAAAAAGMTRTEFMRRAALAALAKDDGIVEKRSSAAGRSW